MAQHVEIAGVTEKDKTVLICRLVMLVALLSLVLRWFSGALPWQILPGPLFNLNLDLTYRTYHYFNLEHILFGQHGIAALFTAALFLSCLTGLLRPQKTYPFIIYTILIITYMIGYNLIITHHSHQLALLSPAALPFFVKNVKNRIRLIEGFRYYICFVYVVAFIFKLTGGSFFVWNNGVNSVKMNLVEYLYHFPDAIPARIISFGIAHPWILNTGHTLILLLEGVMIIGFFTKRYDKWLIWLPIMVHLSTYLFSDVLFVEMFVFIFFFLNDGQLKWIKQRMPILVK